MDICSFQALFSPAGQAALAAAQALAPKEETYLRHFDRLNRQFPAGLARAALETVILRSEAVAKFPLADRMYFTRPALEQATNHEVAAYRAQRYRGFPRLLDLGCSIGGDTLALAALAPVIGVDLDPLRLRMAQANLAALDLAGRACFIQADLTAPLPFSPPSQSGLFFDPARRKAGGDRIYSVEAYHPPLSVVNSWLAAYPNLGVKLSPAVDLSELQFLAAELEFISLRGELKEAVLWFGGLRTATRRATLLPGGHTLTGEYHVTTGEARLSDPLGYLYEPDPAILRAGLVRNLAEQLSAFQLDPQIAYLTASERLPTPFARCWEVEAWFPFNLKRLRVELRARGAGELVVKKRGSPLQPEALIQALGLKGSTPWVVFLTQLRDQPVVVLSKREVKP